MTKKKRIAPTEAQIHATAEVIAHRLRELLSAPLELRVIRGQSRAHLLLRNPERPELRCSFMRLDDEGVEVCWPEEPEEPFRIARGIEDVPRIIEVATPALKAFVNYILPPEDDEVAQPAATEVGSAEVFPPEFVEARHLRAETELVVEMVDEVKGRIIAPETYVRLLEVMEQIGQRVNDLIDRVKAQFEGQAAARREN